MVNDRGAPRLAVIGGGLTGAALAIHAARAAPGPLDIVVVDPVAELGRGAAYGTVDPVHRINVPSHRMSLFGQAPDHFTDWLFARGVLPDAASTDVRGEHYVARAAFGAYAAETLAEAGDRLGIALRHRRARARAVSEAGTGWRVALDDGEVLEADGVALCPGHPAPALPCPVSPAALAHPGFVGNPWRAGAVAGIGRDASVLVVGTGLTMLDVLASLERTGHRGPVVAVSRRGLLARPQGAFPDGYDPFADSPLPRTARDLVGILRRGLAARGAGVGWQEVVDAFRFRLRPFWAALPPAEQRRVVRRLLPFWEVHRFRAAPQPFALAEAWRAAGRLNVLRAAVAALDVEAERLVAALVPVGGTVERRAFDAVVLCTGPGHALRSDPLIADLVARGLAHPDGIGLGIAVDPASRVLDAGNAPQPRLWAFGPVTRGSFGEMTGQPDIVKHIARTVPDLLDSLAVRRCFT